MNSLYPDERAESLWARDYEEVGRLVASGQYEEAEELQSLLWTYAYARYALNTRDQSWLDRAEKADELSLADPEHEEKLSCDAQLIASAKQAYLSLIQQLKMKTFLRSPDNEYTLFEASTSSDLSLRKEAYEYVNHFMHLNQVEMTRLLLVLTTEEIQLSEAYEAARVKIRDTLPLFQEYFQHKARRNPSGQMSWYELSKPDTSVIELNDLADTHSILHSIKAIYRKYSPEWAYQLDELISSERVEASDDSYKLQYAFAMPVPYHQLPLCYLHRVRTRSSLDGLVHELAHGVHFSLYRHHKGGYAVPDLSVEEIFPMMMELLVTREWENDMRYMDKLVTTTFLQYLYVEFKWRLHVNDVKELSQVQEIWVSTCNELIGPHLIMDNDQNYNWLQNRLFWEPHEYGQSYVCGGVGAWNLSDKLYRGEAAVAESLTAVLKLPPSCGIDKWNEQLGMNLYA